MSRRALFKVYGSPRDLDGRCEATVIIDRRLALIAVRPARRRRTYELPLADIAAVVIHRVVLAEAREKRAAKKAARATR